MNILSAKAEITNPTPPNINLGIISAEIVFMACLVVLTTYFLS